MEHTSPGAPGLRPNASWMRSSWQPKVRMRSWWPNGRLPYGVQLLEVVNARESEDFVCLVMAFPAGPGSHLHREKDKEDNAACTLGPHNLAITWRTRHGGSCAGRLFDVIRSWYQTTRDPYSAIESAHLGK